MSQRETHMVLDERFDQAISRKVGRFLAPRLHRMGVTADMISATAATLGVSGGVMITRGGLWPLVGGLLVFAMVVLDCTDGEVARLGPPSDRPWRGKMIDGYADLATLISAHVGMVIALSNTGLTVSGHVLAWWEIALIAVAAWFSFTWKSSVVDAVKARIVGDCEHDLAKYDAQEKTLLERFLYWSWVVYLRSCERVTGQGRPSGYHLYRQVALLGPTHHHMGVAVCAMVAPWSPTIFLAYFALTIGPGNLYVWYALGKARRQGAQASVELSS
jgi:phosphatidylglycerophosphate synthase